MLQLRRGDDTTPLACRSCGDHDLDVVEKKIRVVLGRAVWILHARCGACGASSRWNWPRSVTIEQAG